MYFKDKDKGQEFTVKDRNKDKNFVIKNKYFTVKDQDKDKW